MCQSGASQLPFCDSQLGLGPCGSSESTANCALLDMKEFSRDRGRRRESKAKGKAGTKAWRHDWLWWPRELLRCRCVGDSGTVSGGGKEAAREQLERGLGHSEVTGSHRTALESNRPLPRVMEESNEGAMCMGRRGPLDTTLLSPSLVAKKALPPAGDVKGDLLGPAVRLRRAGKAVRQPGEPRGTGAGEHRT